MLAFSILSLQHIFTATAITFTITTTITITANNAVNATDASSSRHDGMATRGMRELSAPRQVTSSVADCVVVYRPQTNASRIEPELHDVGNKESTGDGGLVDCHSTFSVLKTRAWRELCDDVSEMEATEK